MGRAPEEAGELSGVTAEGRRKAGGWGRKSPRLQAALGKFQATWGP